MARRVEGTACARGAGAVSPAARPGEGGRGTPAAGLCREPHRGPVHAVGGDLHHLQERRQDPEDTPPGLRPGLRLGGPAGGRPFPDRQPAFGRAAHPGARLPAPAGDDAGVGAGLVPGAGPRVDPVVRRAGLQVGFRRRGRLLRRPGAAHLRGGDGTLVRPAHELAGVVAGPLPADVQLRRPLAREAGPGGVRLPHRDGLLRPPPGAGDRRGLRRHPGVLSRGGQVPPGRPPQLQRPAGAGRDPQARRPLPRLRQAADRGGDAPGRGPGRPGDGRGRRPPPPAIPRG